MEKIVIKRNISLDILEKVFKIEERGSSIKTEVLGGLTTF